MGWKRRQLERRAGVPTWVPVLIAVIAMMVLLWIGVSFLTAQAIRREIPELPDFGRYPIAVRDQIVRADEHARAHPTSAAAIGALGMVYHANAFHPRAQTAYQLAHRLDRDDYRWPYYLGIIQITIGENEKAMAFLTAATELNPDYAPACGRLGQLYFHRELYQEAEDAFRETLALDPDHFHARLGIARLAGLRGEWDVTARLMEEYLASHPDNSPAHGMLALAYEQLGRETEARAHESLGADAGFQMEDPALDEVFNLSSTGSILITQSQIAKNDRRYLRAERLLRRAVKLAPEDKDVRLAMARLLSQPAFANPQRLEEAKLHLEKGLEIDPAYHNMRHKYAGVLESLGQTFDAQKQWRTILEDEPKHAMALMSLGQIYFFQRDYERACEYYRQGLAVPPDTPYSLSDPGLGYHRLGLAQQAAGRTTEALESFALAVEHKPRLSQAYIDRARLLRELGLTNDAIEAFKASVELYPGDAELRFGFGNLLLQIESFRSAEEQLQAAHALRPTDPRILAALGFIRFRLGDVDGAVVHLQEAIRVEPRFFLAHYHLGNVLLAQNRRREAITHYQAALRLNPSFEPARQALSRLTTP